MWGASQRIAPIHRIEEGLDDQERMQVQTLIIDKGFREDTTRFSESKFIGDNVHENWIRAYEQNRILRSSLSAITVDFDFNKYHDLYPLDYVNVEWERQLDNKVVTPIIGEWLIVKNEIQVIKSTYSQVVKVAREQLA